MMDKVDDGLISWWIKDKDQDGWSGRWINIMMDDG